MKPGMTFRTLSGGLGLVVLAVLLCSAAGHVLGQDLPAPLAEADSKATQITLWWTIKSGGIVGLFIIMMSLVAVTLVVDHFMTIRRDRLLPDDLLEQLTEQLDQKQYQALQETCAENGSLLAQIVGAGVSQIGAVFGFFDMQNAMQEASEREVSRLYRKLEYLSFISSAAPMLGLLGTVTGMIQAFNQIAETEGTAKPSQLAWGISQALVTTCEGLIVAIPTSFFVSLFRNRIDRIVAETETVVERLMGRFRQA